jgi:hypothetical protein
VGQEWSLRVTFHAPRNIREREGMNPTLPSELPLWKLEFWWTLESSENNCKGQNSLDWKVPYTIEKILKLKCLKWAHITHLGTKNISYGQKNGPGIKLPIWLLTTKSRKISLIYLHLGNVPYTVEKNLTRAITFPWTSSQSEVCTSYSPPKSWES